MQNNQNRAKQGPKHKISNFEFYIGGFLSSKHFSQVPSKTTCFASRSIPKRQKAVQNRLEDVDDENGSIGDKEMESSR